MALANSATGLPTLLQEPIYESISPEWEPMDDTDDNIPNLIDILEKELFQIMHYHHGFKLYSNITKTHIIFLTKGQ